MGFINEPIKLFILVDGKRHLLTLQQMNQTTSYIICEAAGIERAVPRLDLPEFFFKLSNDIRRKREERDAGCHMITFRVSASEKEFIQNKAYERHGSVSDYFRELMLGPEGDRDQ